MKKRQTKKLYKKHKSQLDALLAPYREKMEELLKEAMDEMYFIGIGNVDLKLYDDYVQESLATTWVHEPHKS